MPSAAQLWHVFLVRECRHTNPPKPKYVVIVYVDETQAWGFLVNSIIAPFIKNDPELLACEAEILLKGHRWLRYDSSVDCRLIFPFSDDELDFDQGRVTTKARADILDAVERCEVLEEKYQQAILERERGVSPPPPPTN
jgi:hypothetical protein